MAWLHAIQQWSVIEAYLVQVQKLVLVWVLGAEVLSINMPNLDRHSFVYLNGFFFGVDNAQVSLQRACTSVSAESMQRFANILFAAHQRTRHAKKDQIFCVSTNHHDTALHGGRGHQKEPRALPLLICRPLCMHQGADGGL